VPVLPDAAQVLVQPVARDLVQRAERAHHQQKARPPSSARGSRRAGACRRELMREIVQAVEPHSLSSSRGVGARWARPRKPPLGRQLDILQRGAPGKSAASWNIEAERAVRRASCGRHARAPKTVRWSAQSGRPPAPPMSTCPAARGPSRAQKTAALDPRRKVLQCRHGAVGDEGARHVATRNCQWPPQRHDGRGHGRSNAPSIMAISRFLSPAAGGRLADVEGRILQTFGKALKLPSSA